jgi:glycosyltransferase involved in cell wall biosynthesis
MDVLFLIRSLDPGGAQRQLITLAEGLAGRGWNVMVATFYSGGVFESELAAAGVPVISLDKRGRFDLLGSGFRLLRLIRRFRPAVLHTYGDGPNLAAAAVRIFAPTARLVWGIRSAFMDLSRYDRMWRVAAALQRFLSRLPHLVIVNSEAGRRMLLAAGYPEATVAVVPNGIDMSRYVIDPGGGKRFRRAVGLRDDEVVVGMVARYDPMKDHPTFLRAATLIRRSVVNARFLCAGDGLDSDYGRALQQEAARLGLGPHMLWLPSRDDLSDLYNGLDLLVSSSYGEGFPNVLAEAMACGTAVVATDVGDSARIISNHGRLIPPHDETQLAAAVLAELGLRREKNELREWVSASFGCESLVLRTEQLLFSGLGVRPDRARQEEEE